MGSSSSIPRDRTVTDSVHGDIALTDAEWRVVNTPTFQRLRSLKQLGMGHLVYPNATHTRFAHSLGVFRIMCRVIEQLERQGNHERLTVQRDDLRLAALLHDVGHYPYSHLMERIDWVQLTEEVVDDARPSVLNAQIEKYPDHEFLGRRILMSQSDMTNAIGDVKRAERIGALFSRSDSADPQFSKLIHSSLDMDRLDYLLRDARAAGVPYGEIDLDYLLNNVRISPNGLLGVDQKALAAAEHFLLARVFMHRVVYYHKTTFALEEAARQLLRRVRDCGRYSDIIPADGNAVGKICESEELRSFTDAYVDRIIHKAVSDSDAVIAVLAKCIVERNPPKLLGEVAGLHERANKHNACTAFERECRAGIRKLAADNGLLLGQFLIAGPKPIKFEERGSLMSRADAAKLDAEEREELIMVFGRGAAEPSSIVDVDGSTIANLSNRAFRIQRLYLADDGSCDSTKLNRMRDQVRRWMQ